jgi:hypothetical protein
MVAGQEMEMLLSRYKCTGVVHRNGSRKLGLRLDAMKRTKELEATGREKIVTV